MATNMEDERHQGVKPESEFPGGDLTSKAEEAIAREVAYRLAHRPADRSRLGQRSRMPSEAVGWRDGDHRVTVRLRIVLQLRSRRPHLVGCVLPKALAVGSEPETRPDGRGARALRF